MNNKIVTPWVKIKAEYLAGATPKELSLKYRISANAISNKFSLNGTTKKVKEIQSNLGDVMQVELDEITIQGIKRLKELLTSQEIKPSELISAIRLGFELTILSKNKLEANSKPQPLTPEQRKQISRDFGFE